MPDPSHSGSFLLPILIFLAAAVLAVPLFRAAGMGAVIGYLAAGVAIGPHGLGLIGDAQATLPVAELGVVLLLFIIGLELNPSRQVLLAGRADVTVIDRDVERIRNAARFGFKVYYGDGARLDVLRASGAAHARIIAVCVDKADDANRIVAMCKAEFPMAQIHARAYDRIHALELVRLGVDAFTRETFDAALAFGSDALATLSGDPQAAGEIAADVRQRDFARLALQQAGGAYAPASAGEPPVRPEPLTTPTRRTKALNEEAREIVRSPNGAGHEEAQR